MVRKFVDFLQTTNPIEDMKPKEMKQTIIQQKNKQFFVKHLLHQVLTSGAILSLLIPLIFLTYLFQLIEVLTEILGDLNVKKTSSNCTLLRRSLLNKIPATIHVVDNKMVEEKLQRDKDAKDAQKPAAEKKKRSADKNDPNREHPKRHRPSYTALLGDDDAKSITGDEKLFDELKQITDVVTEQEIGEGDGDEDGDEEEEDELARSNLESENKARKMLGMPIAVPKTGRLVKKGAKQIGPSEEEIAKDGM